MIGFSSLSILSSSSRCKWQNIKQQMSGVPLENWEPPQSKKRKVDSWMVPVSTSVGTLATCYKTTQVKETVIVGIPSKMTKPMNL